MYRRQLLVWNGVSLRLWIVSLFYLWKHSLSFRPAKVSETLDGIIECAADSALVAYDEPKRRTC